jgi:hypothetical protein
MPHGVGQQETVLASQPVSPSSANLLRSSPVSLLRRRMPRQDTRAAGRFRRRWHTAGPIGAQAGPRGRPADP